MLKTFSSEKVGIIYRRSRLTKSRIKMLFVFFLIAAVSADIPFHPLNAPFMPAEERIIGGQEATPHSHPWQVSLQRFGSHFCGGSLISTKYVMTAAHCLVYQSVTANLGAHNWRVPEQSIGVTAQIQHENYDGNTFDYDYGIVVLETKDNILSNNISLIDLAESGVEYPVGTQAITSGWGYIIRFPATIPDTLQEATIPLVSVEDCQKYWGSQIVITNRIQCAAGNGGATSCMGDSGGPLIVPDQTAASGFRLIGAVSWGSGTCSNTAPSGYAKISAVRDWIREKTGL